MGEQRFATIPSSDMGLLFISAFLIYGFNNVTTSAMSEFILSIGGSALVAGVQNCLFVFLAVLLRIALGPLADRHGGKPLLIAGAAGFCIPSIFLPLCNSVALVVALRLLQAIGLAAYHPNVAHYITTCSDSDSCPRRIGIVRFLSTASLMIMPAALFPAIGTFGYGPFFGILSFLAFIGLLLLIPLHNGHRSAHEKAADTIGTHIPRELLPLVSFPFALAFGYSIVLTFGPLFMKEVLPGINSGLLLTFASIGGLLGSPMASKLLMRYGARCSITILGCLYFCGMALLGCAPTNATLASEACMSIGAVTLGIGYFGSTTALTAELGLRREGQTAGFLFSVQQSCLDLGMMAGSLAAGIILQSGISLRIAFIFASALAVTCIIIWVVSYNTHAKQGV